MKNSLVYLGGHIEAIGWQAANDWREQVAEGLAKEGLICFSPTGAWPRASHVKTIGRNLGWMQEVDDEALVRCNIALFAIDCDKPSNGTAHEINVALSIPLTTVACPRYAAWSQKEVVTWITVNADVDEGVVNRNIHISRDLEDAILKVLSLQFLYAST